MQRQPRDRRRSGVVVELTDRDQALLLALSRFRLARTSDLLAFAFGEIRRDTALVRLRRLFDAGFLEVRSGDRSKENVYFLGAAGRQVVAESGGKAGHVPRGGLEHHLGIVRAWSGLAVGMAGRGRLGLVLFRPDWEIREDPAAVLLPLVPDALIQIRVRMDSGESTHLRLALEVDLGSEPFSVLARKLRSYEAALASGGLFGWQDIGLAIFTPDASARRTANVERLLSDSWPGWWTLWRDAMDIDRTLNAFTAEFQPPLTTSPYDAVSIPAPFDSTPA